MFPNNNQTTWRERIVEARDNTASFEVARAVWELQEGIRLNFLDKFKLKKDFGDLDIEYAREVLRGHLEWAVNEGLLVSMAEELNITHVIEGDTVNVGASLGEFKPMSIHVRTIEI